MKVNVGDKNQIIHVAEVQNRIFTIRGLQVMVDRDLAEMYAVSTKRLNEQVKRNIERFPDVFRFELTDVEKDELVANCDRFETMKHSSTLPYVFTEQGIAMLSSVLRSTVAVQVSIQIMNAFVEMRKFIASNAGIFQRLENVEQEQLATNEKFEKIFKALENNDLPPNQGIFYDGQVFDAYLFVADLIKSAKKSILLIDNYIDETVLQLFTKRKKNVEVKIYTKNFSKILKQDLEKHNAQHPKISIEKCTKAHDRFLIVDQTIVYHFGASLKDLGKKWFAFSKMDIEAMEVVTQLEDLAGGNK